MFVAQHKRRSVMKKFILTLGLTFVFAGSEGLAQSSVPGEATPPADAETAPPKNEAKAAPKTKDPTSDAGDRKLSRRERKEKIKNLSEKYRQFLQDVEFIMLPTELNTFLILESDPQRDLYIEEFWRRRDSDPKTTYNEYRDTYAELLVEAKSLFKNLSNDRSRIFLIRGRPMNRLKIDCMILQPIEVWQYGRLPGMGRDVAFIFYVPKIGVDYKLW